MIRPHATEYYTEGMLAFPNITFGYGLNMYCIYMSTFLTLQDYMEVCFYCMCITNIICLTTFLRLLFDQPASTVRPLS